MSLRRSFWDTSQLRAVRSVARPWRPQLSWLALSSYLAGLCEAFFLVAVTNVALALNNGSDVIEIAGRVAPQSTILVLAAAALFGRTALSIFASRQASVVMAGVVAKTRSSLMNEFVTTSHEVQSAEKVGTLHELMTTFANHASSMVSALSKMIISGANLLALIGLAIFVNPGGALLLVVAIAVLATVLRPLRQLLRGRSAGKAEADLAFANVVSETSQLGMELHVFDVRHAAADRVQSRIDAVEKEARKVHFTTGLLLPLYTGLAFIAILGALALVSRSGATDLGSIGAVTLLMLRSMSYGQALQSGAATMAVSSPWVDRTQRKIDLYRSSHIDDGGISLHTFDTIEARNLSFAYPQEPPVLHDLNFRLGPKEVIGVIGPSGAGKSTLVQLLLGLRHPTSGELLVDGRPSSDFGRFDWARRATMVAQSPTLISGSISDNISFFRKDVSDEAIERAARMAMIHDEIVAFPNGYDQEVGPSGSHLSGGQQQRICIARALVERPDLLILDEPTSALDVRSEHLVRETLQRLADEMTIVIIAHRLSTLDLCDRIMVLQEGAISAIDTPAVLERDNDFYREALALSGMRDQGFRRE